MRERSEGRGRLRAAILCAALVLTGVAHSAMDTSSPADTGKGFVPPAAQARLSSLGFHAAVADYYWLMAVEFIGSRFIVENEDALRAGELIDLVTTLDPWVGHPYRFAAMWLTESAEAVVASNRLLRRAIAYHPNDWRNRHYLGFNYFYYLGENLKAARVIEAAIQLPGAPRYLAGLVGKLRTDEDGLETTAAFLHQLVEVTEDEYAKASYLQAVDEVDTERRARLLDKARDVYRKQQAARSRHHFGARSRGGPSVGAARVAAAAPVSRWPRVDHRSGDRSDRFVVLRRPLRAVSQGASPREA